LERHRRRTEQKALIRQLDQSRNEIVHWHVGFRSEPAKDGYQGPAGLVKPDVWPLIKDPEKRVISNQELVQFIDKADFVHRFLNIFFIVLQGEKHEGVLSLRGIFRQPAVYPPEDTNPMSRNYKAPEGPPQPPEE
jgi:hypothetical protein